MKRQREEDRHLELIAALVLTYLGAERRREQRGFERQQAQRELECGVHERAAALTEHLGHRGAVHRDIAARLGVGAARLGQWRKKLRDDRLRPTNRGRPARRPSPARQQQVRELLELVGPSVGLPSLRVLFPDVAKRELVHQVRRFRRSFHEDNQRVVHTLRWTRPGRVWAIDLKEPPTPVDGVFPYVVSVRDLAAGKRLEWIAVLDATAQTISGVIEAAMARHGAPLVLKMDNAWYFHAGDVQRLLDDEGAHPLFSPVYSPSYNGSVEAGIGALSAYTLWQATRRDRAAHWSCDDLHTARRVANALCHPDGPDGGSANERWERRDPITDKERIEFRHSVLARYNELYRNERDAKERELNANELEIVRRAAVSQALRDGEYLIFRKRRIRPDIRVRGLAK